MFIGELARRTGTTPKAIRLYESLGLLGQVQRRGAYRVYTEDTCQQVQLIRQAQALGFRLAELAPVLRAGSGTLDWHILLQQLETKRASILQDIEKLRQREAQLVKISREIRSCLDAPAPPEAAQCILPPPHPLPALR